MSASIVSRPCLAAAAASRARLVSRAARASTASSSSNDKLHARAHPIQVRGLAQIARAKKGGFMAEIEEAKAEESGAKVEFTLPLAIQKYPHVSLRNDNKIIGVFDAELEKLAQAMFKIMYETEGVGLAAPQVGVNYRMMVYNEAGEPGRGKEVVLVNPKISISQP
jgi:N-formylmethionyl-tRNA deformylase